jgi:hypothetical protein
LFRLAGFPLLLHTCATNATILDQIGENSPAIGAARSWRAASSPIETPLEKGEVLDFRRPAARL